MSISSIQTRATCAALAAVVRIGRRSALILYRLLFLFHLLEVRNMRREDSIFYVSATFAMLVADRAR